MVLASQFASIRGIWAGFCASAGGAQRGAIHQSAIPIDLVDGLEFSQEDFEKPLPNPFLLPSPQMPQTGESGGEIGGSRQRPPGDARLQNEENPGDHTSGFTRLSSCKLHMTIFPRFGNQRSQAFPKIIREECSGHEEVLRQRLPQLLAGIVPKRSPHELILQQALSLTVKNADDISFTISSEGQTIVASAPDDGTHSSPGNPL